MRVACVALLILVSCRTSGTALPAREDLAAAIWAGELSDAAWLELMDEAIDVRSPWPVTEPLVIGLVKPAGSGVGQIRVAPRTEGLGSAKVGEVFPYCAKGAWFFGGPRELGALVAEPGDVVELALDVEVERGFGQVELLTMQGEVEWCVYWTGTVTHDVRLVETLDEALPPIDSPEVRDAIRSSFHVARDGWDPHVACLKGCGSYHETLRDVAVSLQVELLHDGELVEECELLGDGTYDVYPFLRSIPSRVVYEPELADGWELRLTGINVAVLTQWGTTHRWNGTLVVPLGDVLRPCADLSRGQRPRLSMTPVSSAEARSARETWSHCEPRALTSRQLSSLVVRDVRASWPTRV